MALRRGGSTLVRCGRRGCSSVVESVDGRRRFGNHYPAMACGSRGGNEGGVEHITC